MSELQVPSGSDGVASTRNIHDAASCPGTAQIALGRHPDSSYQNVTVPLGIPSGILVMDTDPEEEARRARIAGSQDAGISPRNAWSVQVDEDANKHKSPKKVSKTRSTMRSREAFAIGRKGSLRKSTFGKLFNGVRRHTSALTLEDLVDDEDWEYGLWFTSEDDFNPPTFSLSNSEKHKKYFVKAAICKKNYVLHVWEKERLTSGEINSVKKAQQLMQILHHPHIIRCMGHWETETRLFLVEEYCFQGDMTYQLVANKRNLTERYVANSVAKPILSALSYIHNLGVLHRAVWPENVVISRDGNTRLSCFLHAADLNYDRPQTRFGYIDYMAPEVIRSDGSKEHGGAQSQATASASSEENANSSSAYDEKVDIWQLGTLVFEMLAGKCPFEVEDPNVTAALILWTSIQKYPSEFSPAVISFLESALVKDPALRPSADELLEHPWIKDNEALEKTSTIEDESAATSRCGTPAIITRTWESFRSWVPRLFPSWSRAKSESSPVEQCISQDEVADLEVKRILVDPLDSAPVQTPVTPWEGSSSEVAGSRIAWSSPGPE